MVSRGRYRDTRGITVAKTRRVARYLATALALALALTVVPGSPREAVAAAPMAKAAATLSGSEFVAGNIISDALFYDDDAMTAGQIQSFLDEKIGRCENGACLNVVRVSHADVAPYVSSDTGRVVCEAVAGGSNLTVATWIFRVQAACSISAKVILVTLQKEQGLVTKTAPSDYALRYAMGMDCPDTTGCQTTGGGLASQIYRGTRQLMIYKASEFLRQPGWHAISYHPSGACGASQVRVQNYATAALYNYTPYQPNAAALANLTGTGDSCSSYGNRNFWRYYNSWFGPTTGVPTGSIDGGPGVYTVDASGVLRFYSGTGQSSFRAAATVGSGWGAMSHVTGIGDLDGDGHRDVVAVDGSGSLLLYPSDGLTAFGTARAIGTGWGEMTAVFSAGDTNRDGLQDIFARSAAGALLLYRAVPGGRLAPPLEVGAGWGSMTTILSTPDFNGDGRADLIARDASGRLWLYPGVTGTTWGKRIQIGSGWQGFTWIGSPGDFNGDRTADLLAADAAGNLYLYPATGRGGWGRGFIVGRGWQGFSLITGIGPLPTGRFVQQQGVGDLNGDGARDLVARDAAGKLWLYGGTGTGGWRPRVAIPGTWDTVQAIFGNGDVDLDGVAEAFSRDAAGDLMVSDATVTGLSTGAPLAGSWRGYNLILGAGDLDSDVIPDLLARDSSGRLWFSAGDGAGGFGAAIQVGSGWSGMTSIIPIGDFDGDGVADLLARDAAGALWLYPGTGEHSWYSRVQVGSGWQGMTRVFSPGDTTGDRVPDLIAIDAAGGMHLYPGNGNGTFLSRRTVGSGWQTMTFVG
jgi:hypothetical protein